MQYILTISLTCVAVLLSVILGLFLQREQKTELTRRFKWVIWVSIFFILLNMGSYLCDGHKEVDTLSFVLNLLTFISVDAVFVAFNYYLTDILRSSSERKCKWLSVFTYITIVANVITIIVLTFTNNLFSVKDGVYKVLEYGYVAYIFSALIFLELIVLILINWRCFTKRQLIVVLIYVFLPVPALILEALYSDMFSLIGVATTISILLIYIITQDTTIEKSKIRAAMLEEVSNKDILTDLNNRRAFYSFANNLDQNQDIGIIYFDMNGLKYTNDHYGHNKGDELIQTFSLILTSVFDQENIFRIAGDEFIVILPSIIETDFMSRYKSIRNKMINSNHIASVGKAFGKANDINSLLIEAEKDMYLDKNAFKRSALYKDLYS